MLLFILLSGEQPFRSDSDGDESTKQVLQKVRGHRSLRKIFTEKTDYGEESIWLDISPDVKELLDKQMLNRDPAKRLTAKELYSHPWIAGTSAPTRAIPKTLLPLHKAWLKRKFRVAIFAMMATNRIKVGGQSLAAATAAASCMACTVLPGSLALQLGVPLH
eukprot:SAG22_NODE_2055_length_3069_cov_2.983502_2_plen_162_part_00